MDNRKTAPTNRLAILSLAAGSLTLVSFCIALVPIPFTGYVCFPTAALLGPTAVVSGLMSLRQIRRSQGKGHLLAKLGIGMGALVIGGGLCMAGIAILLWPRLADLTQLLQQ